MFCKYGDCHIVPELEISCNEFSTIFYREQLCITHDQQNTKDVWSHMLNSSHNNNNNNNSTKQTSTLKPSQLS